MPDTDRTPTAPILDIRERLSRVEWNQEHQEKRLNEGSEAFSDVRRSLADITDSVHRMTADITAATAPRALPWKWISAFAFTLMCAFSGGVWALARYPDRAEFREVQTENHASHKAMEMSLGAVETSQALQVQSIDEIDKKIGKIGKMLAQ